MNEDNSNPDLAPDSELDAGPDTTGWDVPPRSQRAAKSVTQLRAMSAGVLVPEAIVLALSAPVLMLPLPLLLTLTLPALPPAVLLVPPAPPLAAPSAAPPTGAVIASVAATRPPCRVH